MDRAALAAIVFADEDRAPPAGGDHASPGTGRAAEITAAAPPDAVVVNDVPLLVEAGLAGQLRPGDRGAGRRGDPGWTGWSATAGMTEAEARARIAAQATDEQRRAVADVGHRERRHARRTSRGGGRGAGGTAISAGGHARPSRAREGRPRRPVSAARTGVRALRSSPGSPTGRFRVAGAANPSAGVDLPVWRLGRYRTAVAGGLRIDRSAGIAGHTIVIFRKHRQL